MIRITNSITAGADANGNLLAIANIYGTSTDAKPVAGFANGTSFVEVDTGKLYLLNEEDGTWTEVQ